MWFVDKTRGTALIDKVGSLSAGNIAPTKDILTQFYGVLSILDVKATGLLTVNAIAAAVLTAFLAADGALAQRLHMQTSLPILEIQLGLLGASSLFCLVIIRVTWRFFAIVPNAPTQPADFETELKRLANVIDDRTHYYVIAWWLAIFAFGATMAWWSVCGAAIVGIVIIVWLCTHG
jgi:hypothetical protein